VERVQQVFLCNLYHMSSTSLRFISNDVIPSLVMVARPLSRDELWHRVGKIKLHLKARPMS